MVHLELFHCWHAAALKRRLTDLDGKRKVVIPLAIGVDRAILKKEHALERTLQRSPWFKAYGILFREFPTVNKVVNCLDQFIES